MKNLSTWAEVSLGEICELKYGKSLPELKRTGGNIPVFGSNGIIGQHNEAITDGSTIVIGRKGSLGEVNFSNVSCWPIDTTYYVDKSATDTDLKWLAYQLSGLGLTKLNKAAAVPGLNREDAYRQRLLLPPLEEQRRIAEVLDRAEELRSKRREAIAQLDTFTQAIFIEMFGEPATNPKGWERIVLADVITSASDGPHVSPKYAELGIPFLSTRHIRRGGIDWTDLKFISADEAEVQWKKCRPQRGDILYTKGGTTGIAATVNFDAPFAVWVHVALLKTNKNKIEPKWLENMLNSSFCYQQSQRLTHGIANRDLGLKRMVRIEMFLPPFSLQSEFVRRVEAVEKLKAAHRASLSELNALFASLQHRAFRGEL